MIIMTMKRLLIVTLSLVHCTVRTKGYSHNSVSFSQSRRLALNRLVEQSALTISTAIILSPSTASAKFTAASIDLTSVDIATLQDGYDALTSLLDNWERATVNCIFADVPRELLEQKNKAELLEKASTFALFDKSTSVVSCKKTNRIVRDYIGVTGKGPLVNAEKKMMRPGMVELVDVDYVEDYFFNVEAYSQAMSKASSLSYTAGVADLDSVNTFAKGSETSSGDGADSNLEQARRAISDARVSLKNILTLVSTTDTIGDQ